LGEESYLFFTFRKKKFQLICPPLNITPEKKMNPYNTDTVTFPAREVVLTALQKNEKLIKRYNPPKTLIDAIAKDFSDKEWMARTIQAQVEWLSKRVAKNDSDNWNPSRDYPYNILAIVEILNEIGIKTLDSKSRNIKCADTYTFLTKPELLKSLQEDEYLMRQTKECQTIIDAAAGQFEKERISDQNIDAGVHKLLNWYNLQPESKKLNDNDREFIERALSASLKNSGMPPLNPS
jgi:hypothetical protein